VVNREELILEGDQVLQVAGHRGGAAVAQARVTAKGLRVSDHQEENGNDPGHGGADVAERWRARRRICRSEDQHATDDEYAKQRQ